MFGRFSHSERKPLGNYALTRWGFQTLLGGVVSWIAGWGLAIVVDRFFPWTWSLPWLSPGLALGSVAVAYFVNRRFESTRVAAFAWVLPMVFLILSVWDQRPGFSSSWAHQTFWQYIWSTYFTADCGTSECLYLGLITTPLVSSIAYSLAMVCFRYSTRGEADRGNESVGIRA
jgi:hypothetical protein